ncbi:MAG TPA: TlpA family protein disulfide reductase [Campylobacterales bacterium]|nr:TlpA family protein disulfide reductase [Campylobacterales bacterium]
MITKFIPIIVVSILLFTGCGNKEEAGQEKQSKSATQKQEPTSNIINLKTTDGQTIKLTALDNGISFEGYKGKIILLDFFATWCPPCLAEIPHLVEIQNTFKDHVQIIGVLMEESKSNEELEEFRDSKNMNFPVTNSKENFQLSDALGGIKSLPTMVMYDKNGEYYTHYVGAAPQEMIEKDIQEAIAKTVEKVK